MKAIDPLKDLLEKKMSRKQFLAHLGLSLVSLVGVHAAIQALTEPGKKAVKKDSTKPVRKFGSGTYGG